MGLSRGNKGKRKPYGWTLIQYDWRLYRASQVAQCLRICLSVGDEGLIPESGRSLGVENGNPLQYSCLGNPTERGAWRSTVYGAAKSQTQLSTCVRTHTHKGSLLEEEIRTQTQREDEMKTQGEGSCLQTKERSLRRNQPC